MKQRIIMLLSVLISMVIYSQNEIKGIVYEITDNDTQIPLSFANVLWLGTHVGTQTNERGEFTLSYNPKYSQLMITFVGFESDTIKVNNFTFIEHVLRRVHSLDEIVIDEKKNSLQRSSSKIANMIIMTSKELLKAACCNLSESFETNPSIDVNFSDAMTGNKQIKMLGLTSPYVLIAEENIPSVRGGSQVYGLSFTPGTWIESIQITKGAGSVINGFESISGQINTELIKPANDIPFFLNMYASNDGRFELNTHFNRKISDKWSSSLFIHGNMRVLKMDMNRDGFLDNPLSNQVNVLNRWQYADNEKGWVSFLNFRYMKDEKQSGQLDFDPKRDKLTMNHWGAVVNTEKVDFSAKLGYVFPEMPYQSIGFQTAFNRHKQDSYFGLNQYDIDHKSFFSNLIFNSIIENTMNKFSLGLNFMYDQYGEFVNNTNFGRIDNSAGVFFEYTYDNTDNFSLVAGARLDNHNRMGLFVTPRLHMKYHVWEDGIFRLSAGKGRRIANIFAENQHLFSSSRKIQILDSNGKAYGLNPEKAWNYGISFIQGFNFFDKKAQMIIDFYRTDFQNQVVVDLYESSQHVLFYNLRGSSYANSFQLEFNYEFSKYLNLRTAYKYYDVRTDYLNEKLEQPLQPQSRFFTNLSYETPFGEQGQQWRFDYTYNWMGKQRLPYTESNPESDRLSTFASPFSLMNIQVTKVFSYRLEAYFGIENLTDYTQEKPILGSQDPFGPYFDSSIIYAPIFGRMFYVGVRFNIN